MDQDHDLRQFKTLTLDRCCKVMEIGTIRQRLSVSEFAIMDLLTRRPGMLFSRSQIMDAIFGTDAGYCTDRVCDSHIKRLRKQGVTGLLTHYGSGYYWEDRVVETRGGLHKRTTIIPRQKVCDHCGAPIPKEA